MSKVKLHFHGGVDSVTGSNFILEGESCKIMIDCGLAQGFFSRDKDPNYEDFKYNPKDIDFLISTHAHIDHIGRVPKLVKDGFQGEIISTESTHKIAPIMFEDAVDVLRSNAKRLKKDPIYKSENIENALRRWKSYPYHQEIDLNKEFKLYFKDAGHILGSSIVYIIHKKSGKKFVFTGDLGNTPTPLQRAVEKIDDADYLIMESVYGDRNHEGRDLRKEKLKQALLKIIQRKGTILIPAFSLEKTQVLLHEINDFIESGELPNIPVFFDSPLGIRLTEIYKNESHNFNKKVRDRISRGDDIFDFPKLKKTYSAKDSRSIRKIKGPKIIIASSGMSVGGRILRHEIEYLPDSKNAILFIGYQSAGSLGRAIKEKSKYVYINNKKIRIKADVINISGYSSHMDSDNLLEFVANTSETVKKVFVVMGESKSALYLTQKIRDNLDLNAIHPGVGDVFEIDV